jgi:hypothetical protein
MAARAKSENNLQAGGGRGDESTSLILCYDCIANADKSFPYLLLTSPPHYVRLISFPLRKHFPIFKDVPNVC